MACSSILALAPLESCNGRLARACQKPSDAFTRQGFPWSTRCQEENYCPSRMHLVLLGQPSTAGSWGSGSCGTSRCMTNFASSGRWTSLIVPAHHAQCLARGGLKTSCPEVYDQIPLLLGPSFARSPQPRFSRGRLGHKLEVHTEGAPELWLLFPLDSLRGQCLGLEMEGWGAGGTRPCRRHM